MVKFLSQSNTQELNVAEDIGSNVPEVEQLTNGHHSLHSEPIGTMPSLHSLVESLTPSKLSVLKKLKPILISLVVLYPFGLIHMLIRETWTVTSVSTDITNFGRL